jgi:hypothetical protein
VRKCIDIKDKEGLHSEEEEEEEEDMDIQEEEDIKIKEEVRMRIQCNILWNEVRNSLGYLYVCMSVIRAISAVFRSVSYVCLIRMYSLCKDLQCWEWKCVTGIFCLVREF